MGLLTKISSSSTEKMPCTKCADKDSGNNIFKCTSEKSWTDCGYEYDCEYSDPLPKGMTEDSIDGDCDGCPATFCQNCAEGVR